MDLEAALDRSRRDGGVLVVHVAHNGVAVNEPAVVADLTARGYEAIAIAVEVAGGVLATDVMIPRTVVFRAGVEIERVWRLGGPTAWLRLLACVATGRRYVDRLREEIATRGDHFDERVALAQQLGFGRQFAAAADECLWLLRHGQYRPIVEREIERVLAYVVARSPEVRSRIVAERAALVPVVEDWLFLCEVLDDPEVVVEACREQLARERPDPDRVQELEGWLERHLRAHDLAIGAGGVVVQPCKLYEDLKRMTDENRMDARVPGHVNRTVKRLLHARLQVR